MATNTSANAAIVSCDIVGHGALSSHVQQLHSIQGLNDCIRAACKGQFDQDVIWASGGDGGHVAFLDDSLRGTALGLIRDLFSWSRETRRQDPGQGLPEIRLRLTAHYGPVSIVEGADQRRQLVGEGINLGGSLLSFGTPDAVVVSSAFRDFVLRGRGTGDDLVDRTSFHHEQSIYLKHFVSQRLYFMSIAGDLESQWGFPDKSDRLKLEEASEKRRWWRVIYHAKRLLRVDSTDQEARRKLESINPNQLLLAKKSPEDVELNPLLGHMGKEALIRLIRAAHLVERDDGELICANEDSGDTMFIVLKGQIGVVIERGPTSAGAVEQNPPSDPPPYSEGQNLGELALALQRRRTASLQAVGSTALLAMDYATLSSLLYSVPENDRLKRSFNEFLLSRILEHICRKTDYLACDEGGPLAGTDGPWDGMVDGSKQIVLSWDKTVSSEHDEFKAPGLYILASGRITEASPDVSFGNNLVKQLDGHDFPILYVDLPDEFVNVHHNYRFDPNQESKTISVVRIPDRELKKLGAKVFAKLVAALKRQVCKQSLFDAFISYNHHDEHVATAWYNALTKAGLQVYMSRPEAMRRFKNEIAVALKDALVMVPIVSQQALRPDGEESWVQREIRYRQGLFDEDHCNILPIEISPGIAGELADGFSAVCVTGSGDAAMEEVIETIRAVRAGKKPPPCSRQGITKPVL